MIDNQESVTAKLCSFARAYHASFDRLQIFDDYLAYDFMGQEEYGKIRRMIEDGLCEGCTSATCTIHEKVGGTAHCLAPIPLSREAYRRQRLRGFIQRHHKCQYVICGAGMDTFLFRNDNPDITIFEVDHPDTQRYKKHRIQQLGWAVLPNIHFVPVDFSHDILSDALLLAGFDPNMPAFFTILGVTYYLSLRELEKTIEQMDAIASVYSTILLDYPDKTTFGANTPDRVRRLTEMTARLGERMTQGFSFEEMERMFQDHHFDIQEHLGPKDIQKLYFTHRTDGLSAYENIHFLYAEKGQGYYEAKNLFSI